MEKSESIKELAIALNKAQVTLQVAKKGSENPFFHSKYADLLSIWDACREALTSNGLSISQIADTGPEGKAVLETVLMHISGEWIKGRLPLLPVKADPQAQGSAITYARRYSLSAIIGLCTEEDDDAEAAMNRGKSKESSEIKGHWCSIHKTPFFKKGGMKGYAHPIKDEIGDDTGEWCNELTKAPETKPEPETQAPSQAKTPVPIKLATQAKGVPPAETPETNDETWEEIGKETASMPAGKKIQNITELKGLMGKHKIGTREAYEILSIGSFMELIDLDQAWVDIKKAKGIK